MEKHSELLPLSLILSPLSLFINMSFSTRKTNWFAEEKPFRYFWTATEVCVYIIRSFFKPGKIKWDYHEEGNLYYRL